MARLAKAKTQGVKLGRPTDTTRSLKSAILELNEKGMGPKRICSLLKVGCGTYYKVFDTSKYALSRQFSKCFVN